MTAKSWQDTAGQEGSFLGWQQCSHWFQWCCVQGSLGTSDLHTWDHGTASHVNVISVIKKKKVPQNSNNQQHISGHKHKDGQMNSKGISTEAGLRGFSRKLGPWDMIQRAAAMLYMWDPRFQSLAPQDPRSTMSGITQRTAKYSPSKKRMKWVDEADGNEKISGTLKFISDAVWEAQDYSCNYVL